MRSGQLLRGHSGCGGVRRVLGLALTKCGIVKYELRHNVADMV